MERELAQGLTTLNSWLLLLTCWLALLVVGGVIINALCHPWSRKWIRRLRGIENGRAAQRRAP